jgi:hypothetical protein
MKGIAKTREILLAYKKGGMKSVSEYLFDPELEFREETWSFKAKYLLEHNCWRSLKAEIDLILYKFDLNGKEAEEPNGEDS